MRLPYGYLNNSRSVRLPYEYLNNSRSVRLPYEYLNNSRSVRLPYEYLNNSRSVRLPYEYLNNSRSVRLPYEYLNNSRSVRLPYEYLNNSRSVRLPYEYLNISPWCFYNLYFKVREDFGSLWHIRRAVTADLWASLLTSKSPVSVRRSVCDHPSCDGAATRCADSARSDCPDNPSLSVPLSSNGSPSTSLPLCVNH